MTEDNITKQVESPFQRLQRDLGKLIAAAKPGDRLPTEPDLAKQLRVSRSTLREAMRSFETQGLLIRKQGSGTFRADATGVFETGLEVLDSLETLAARLGLNVSMGDLHVQQIPADENMAHALNIEKDSPLVSVSRIITVKGQPAAFLRDILPQDVIASNDLEEGFTGSVLDLLIRHANPMPEKSSTQINVISAPHEVARALDIQRGEALLMFEADLVDSNGRVIDHSFSWFLPGYFRFHVNRKIGII
jgi:GntR family transcriptional regulator